MSQPVNTQKLTILAQDPGVRIRGRLAVAQVEIPAERLIAGPTGYRVKVIDFDGGANLVYTGCDYDQDATGAVIDPFEPPKPEASAAKWKAYEKRILGNPQFHAQNTYAIAMRILAIFERALGRRVEWGFGAHQLHIAPHAMAEANAFYSYEDQALMFGYFTGKSGATVFTSLSHDIVAHETTHALLDGMRHSYIDPSIPEQAAFHEGFADVVALLSVFALPEVVKSCLLANEPPRATAGIDLIPARLVERKELEKSLLLGLGKQFGQELRELRGDVLRRSVQEKPATLIAEAETEPHRLGEVFAAAMLNAFLDIWLDRIGKLGTFGRGMRNLDSVAEEGSKVADHLLDIAIRALDYCPAVDLSFSAYLAALLTADAEVSPDDTRFFYRPKIRDSFKKYGIVPPRNGVDAKTGQWIRFDKPLLHSRSHFESMLRDKEEVFRFIWENRRELAMDRHPKMDWRRAGLGYTRVNFVRPAIRVGPEGLLLRETIVEYVQTMQLFGAEVKAYLGCERPKGMPTTQSLKAYGGGTLVFDQYGQVKYHVCHPVYDPVRQKKRLDYLWKEGYFRKEKDLRRPFAAIHRNRATF